MKSLSKSFPWGLLAFLGACASTLPQLPQEPDPSAFITERQAYLYPLPGALNDKTVFYSNRPELIKTPGEILNSGSLNHDFSVFAHHVVETEFFDFSGFRLGLLVRPAQQESLTLTLHKAFMARTRPESPFIPLDPVLKQSVESPAVSGPGDAMAWARLQQHNLYPASALPATLPLSLTLDKEILLTDIDVSTFPLGFIGERNTLSAWLDISTTGPVEMRWVAIKTTKASASLLDYQQAAQQAAGPQELPATNYDPKEAPPKGVFRFGRVAGLVQGTQWQGEQILSPEDLERLRHGTLLAWPVATTYLKSWAKQNQSAPVIVRQKDSAVESHGNYGIDYQVSYRLKNINTEPLTLQWQWTQPNTVKKTDPKRSSPSPGSLNTLSYTPKAQIVFRGSIQVQDSCKEMAANTDSDIAYHLQTQEGHWHTPFYIQTIPPGADCQIVFRWVYPPDAIPPQLLSVAAVANP